MLNQNQRIFSNPAASASFPAYSFDGRYPQDTQQHLAVPGLRRSASNVGRGMNNYTGNQIWNPFNNMTVGMTGTNGRGQPFGGMQAMPMVQQPAQYQPRPIGTPLSPTAAEFNAPGALTTNPGLGTPWGSSMVCFLKYLRYVFANFCSP